MENRISELKGINGENGIIGINVTDENGFRELEGLHDRSNLGKFPIHCLSEVIGRFVINVSEHSQTDADMAAAIALAFYDEIMSVEGEGDFYQNRMNPRFWLGVEEYVTREVPDLKKKLEELQGIISFIPDFIISRARRFFKHFGHERERDDPEVSIQEGSEHDEDGLEENRWYAYSRGGR